VLSDFILEWYQRAVAGGNEGEDKDNGNVTGVTSQMVQDFLLAQRKLQVKIGLASAARKERRETVLQVMACISYIMYHLAYIDTNIYTLTVLQYICISVHLCRY
jgi:hypothetical protein